MAKLPGVSRTILAGFFTLMFVLLWISNLMFEMRYPVDSMYSNAFIEAHLKTNPIDEDFQKQSNLPRLESLSCSKYGGPDDSLVQELIYWEDIPSDAEFKSPFYDTNKYLTFEPDHGGWNNIRMAFETIVVMAHAFGRTLVLPPKKKMYLLGRENISFETFFHLDSIKHHLKGLNVISMEEFLRREGLTRNLGRPPPDGKVSWDGVDQRPLLLYLRDVALMRAEWDPMKCLAGIPARKGKESIRNLEEIDKRIRSMTKDELDHNKFVGKPVGSDASAFDRLRENMGGREGLCIYDQEMQDAKVIHFKVDHGDHTRMLTHFYEFVFFEDWKQDLWAKRFVRDHMRYRNEVYCAAAKIVNAVRTKAKEYNPKNKAGIYDSFHVRRGKSMHFKSIHPLLRTLLPFVIIKATFSTKEHGKYTLHVIFIFMINMFHSLYYSFVWHRLEASKILSISEPHLEKGSTLYIATDEKGKEFFNEFRNTYDIHFLSNFTHLVPDIPPYYYGMLDQIVASRGNTFFGTWFSSFSGYINRMRGYYSVKNKLDGYEDGVLRSWYFTEDRHEEMREYRSSRLPLYMREFPTSWRDIDKGIEELL